MSVHRLKHATLEKWTVGDHKKFCKAPLFRFIRENISPF